MIGEETPTPAPKEQVVEVDEVIEASEESVVTDDDKKAAAAQKIIDKLKGL